MPLVKLKPTSAGRRAMVKVVHPHLHKGRPLDSLLEKQMQNAGRNNNGHITTRHRGGGHKQHYRVVDFKRTKDGIPSSPRAVLKSALRWCLVAKRPSALAIPCRSATSRSVAPSTAWK